MKRIIYIVLIVTLDVLVGCTKHIEGSTTQVAGQPCSYIFFEPKVYDCPVTKTAILNETSLPSAEGTAFGVLGYHGETTKTSLFSNTLEKVSRQGDGTFGYGNLASWIDDADHEFHAFYIHGDTYDNSAAKVIHNNGAPYIEYTQPSSMAQMYDILTAYTETKKVSLVPLNFEHRLWALDINIQNNQTPVQIDENNVVSGTELQITSIRLYVSGLSETARINISGGEISTGNKDFTYTVSEKPTSIAAGTATDFGSLLFLPCTSFSYKIEVGYETGTSTGIFYYPDPENYAEVQNLSAGNRYNLTINRTNDKFFVGLNPEDWTTQEIDHTFN